MQPSKSLKLLRDFSGMVNQYRDMLSHRLHILAPLTAKTGVPKMGEKHPPFQWTPEAQKLFDPMKAVMAADVLCDYPNLNEPLHIHTDASNLVHVLCKMIFLLHTKARSLLVRR
jgi:hypothetical protein